MALPIETVGLRLCKIANNQLVLCEAILFSDGRHGVETVLSRAKLAGRVEVGGDIEDHFADALDKDRTILETVALDAKSYRSLKTKWMRCKIEDSRVKFRS